MWVNPLIRALQFFISLADSPEILSFAISCMPGEPNFIGGFFGEWIFGNGKDLDEMTNSLEVTSSNEESNTQLPAIIVSEAAQLVSMETLDDIDDDEAFINELMAMHPNDEDLVVEDLEGSLTPTIGIESIPEGEEAMEDAVSLSRVCCYRSQLSRNFLLVELLSLVAPDFYFNFTTNFHFIFFRLFCSPFWPNM